MKLKVMFIVGMLVVSAILVVQSIKAQPYTGSVILMDGYGHEQDYFEPSDSIYFEVTVLDAGVPLQSQTVDVIILGLAGIGEVFNNSYLTDSYGQFTGNDWDGYWYTHDIGDYIMFVNYTGTTAVQVSFRIYDPVPWSATGWTAYYGAVTDVFTEDQRVEVYVRALDQYGNPYDGGYGDVWYEIMHLGNSVDTEYLSTDSSGEDMDYFYPEWEYDEQFGVYQGTIYNDAVPAQVIGYFNFTVALPTNAIVQPQHQGENRTVFTAGESVGYAITLYYLDEPYDSEDYAARLLLYRLGEVEPLENDTLRTNSQGVDIDTYYYWIGMSEDDEGTYQMKVYSHDWEEIGSALFMVIDLDIEIIPHKPVYAQGDEVELKVTTTLEEAYNVRVTAPSHNTLSGWNVPAGTNLWGRQYTMPNLQDGIYHVEVYMGTLPLDSLSFELKKLTVGARLNQEAYLPGHEATLFWRAIDNHDGGPIEISGGTDLYYTDDGYDSASMALNNIAGSAGEFQFEIPEDARQGEWAHIEVEANDNQGHSDSTSVSLYIGWLDMSIGTDRGYYRPGEDVLFTFYTHVGSNSPAPDVELAARVEHQGTQVGNGWTITTDDSGKASNMYTIPASAPDGVYSIVVSGVFGQNRDISTQETSLFTVSSDPVLALILYQPKDIYVPGESVSIPYRVLRDGQETTAAQVSYEARLGTSLSSWGDASTIAFGFGSNGYINFQLPYDLEGNLLIQATARTTEGYQAHAELGGYGWGSSSMTVTKTQLLLFSTKSIYLPGENVTWVLNLLGDSILQANYRITDPEGVPLAEGVPVDGTFSYQLPTEYARTVTATVFVTGANATYTASDAAPVYEGFIIEYKIKKHSYSPGSQMSINYTIIKVGHGPEAVNGHIVVISISGEYSETVWVDKPMGTLTFQLPEDIRDGKHIFSVSLEAQGDSFLDLQTIIIDSDAGDLAHGTILGLNASAFLVLLFAIAALIIAIVGVSKWRRMQKTVGHKEDAQPTPEEPQPVEEPAQVGGVDDQSSPETYGTTPEPQGQDYSQTPPPPPGWSG